MWQAHRCRVFSCPIALQKLQVVSLTPPFGCPNDARVLYFVLTQDANPTPAVGSPGIAKHFGNVNLFNIADVDVETLCQVARIDGAVIVSQLGMVLNAGVILKLSDGFASTEQGARSAAAALASADGVALG